ncbi:MAG: zinc ribbon domain-containing protein, partial [Gemmatimonadales bacterium]
DQAQAAHARIAEAKAAVEELQALQAEERTRLGAEASEVEGRREGAVAERKSSAKEVEKPLLIQYNRLRSTRKTAVVVALAGPTCGACFTAVPLNRRAQIRSGALIAGCETCGVILYANEEE